MCREVLYERHEMHLRGEVSRERFEEYVNATSAVASKVMHQNNKFEGSSSAAKNFSS